MTMTVQYSVIVALVIAGELAAGVMLMLFKADVSLQRRLALLCIRP